MTYSSKLEAFFAETFSIFLIKDILYCIQEYRMYQIVWLAFLSLDSQKIS